MFASFFVFLKTKVVVPLVTGLIALFGIAPPPSHVYVPEKVSPAAVALPVATPTLPSPASPVKKAATVATATPEQKTAAAASPEVKISALKRSILAQIDRGERLPTEEVNARVRSTLMNVFCTTRVGGDFSSISGTGIVISGTGLVLTNAHLAQYLLLKDYGGKDSLTCVGRTGNPVVPVYTLELAYIPRSWVEENASKIRDERAVGTGEHDFAFLAVTGMVSGAPLPPLPYAALETEDVFVTGTPVLLAAYPAGFLGGILVSNNLWLTSSADDIDLLYYFNDKTNIDAFSVTGNILSQKGASGGAVVSLLSGKLLGMITTATDAATTGERDLTALTLTYIKSEFEKDTGKAFERFLDAPPAALVKEFDEHARRALETIMIKALERR
ncbi:MAG: serine protease [bacterium]|nr:serine protease [bacterium]